VASPRYYYPYYPAFYYPGFYYPGFYYSGFYGGFYSPFYWGYGFPYQYGPYPYYGPIVYDNTGSARLQVTPRNTRVYVDGYFAGLVDDFDGYLQRLNAVLGEHELQFYLEGYRTFSQKVLFVRGSTLKLTHAMEALAPGETAGPAPKPDPAQARPAPAYREPGSGRPMPPPGAPGEASTFGAVVLRLRPADATVFVDGEAWTAPQGEDQLTIELAEGPHRIEVRKDGFQTYSTTVRVRRGDAIKLNVSLTAGGMSGGF
jgi:hypothetical protein